VAGAWVDTIEKGMQDESRRGRSKVSVGIEREQKIKQVRGARSE
jgi:hypothetical protein